MPVCDDCLRITNLLFKANHYDWHRFGIPRAIRNLWPPERLRSEAGSCFGQAFPPLRLDQSPSQMSDWARSARATSCARASAVEEDHVLRLVIGRCIEDCSQAKGQQPVPTTRPLSIGSIAKRLPCYLLRTPVVYFSMLYLPCLLGHYYS